VTGPALDPAVLEGLRQLNQPGQPDLVREVLAVFLSDAPGRLDAIDNAIRASDPQAIQRAAHALKGAAASIGAMPLQARCRELEELGKSARLDSTAELGGAIRDEWARVRAEIAEILATG
jgi:two-component system, sensor histidine kinase and response regulator